MARKCRCSDIPSRTCRGDAARCRGTSGAGIRMFGVVEAFGVQVVEIDGLRDLACMVDGEEVALVRADLTPDLRERVVDWLLHEALRTGRASCA